MHSFVCFWECPYLQIHDGCTAHLVYIESLVGGLGSVDDEELLQAEERDEDEHGPQAPHHQGSILSMGPQLTQHHPHDGQQEQEVDLASRGVSLVKGGGRKQEF